MTRDEAPQTTTVAITTVKVLTPPQRSEIQPPKMRSVAPMKAASIVNWPAWTLLT